jgi:hypothetical protein
MNEPTQAPGGSGRMIFRPEVLQRYLQGREEAVLPRYAAPPVVAALWALAGVLAAGAAIVALARVPTYSQGPGLIAAGGEQAVVFLPSEDLPRLRAGQPIRLWLDSKGAHIDRRIDTVASSAVSPAEARRRYKLDGAEAAALTRPAAVVTVELGRRFNGLAYAGSILPAVVDTGSERLAARLALVGARDGQ